MVVRYMPGIGIGHLGRAQHRSSSSAEPMPHAEDEMDIDESPSYAAEEYSDDGEIEEDEFSDGSDESHGTTYEEDLDL
ncbi:hypothetical protein FRC08_000489 [Ceratobasidium sp. 394]|nr:hypothetical protein FRC08_000489 [Ceratobasidium sp. 394]